MFRQKSNIFRRGLEALIQVRAALRFITEVI